MMDCKPPNPAMQRTWAHWRHRDCPVTGQSPLPLRTSTPCAPRPLMAGRKCGRGATMVADRTDGTLARGEPTRLVRAPSARLNRCDLNAFEARFALKLPVAFRGLYRWRHGKTL